MKYLEALQQKALKKKPDNKALGGPAENKTAPKQIVFASAAASKAADRANVTDDELGSVTPSSEQGYTAADVARVVAARE